MSVVATKHTKTIMVWKHADLHDLRQAEGYDLRDAQLLAPLKDHIVVDVDQLAAALVKEDVVQVAVPQPQQPANLHKRMHSSNIIHQQTGCNCLYPPNVMALPSIYSKIVHI